MDDGRPVYEAIMGHISFDSTVLLAMRIQVVLDSYLVREGISTKRYTIKFLSKGQFSTSKKRRWGRRKPPPCDAKDLGSQFLKSVIYEHIILE